MVPEAIGVLGVVSKGFDTRARTIRVNIRLEVIQIRALLGTARIIRKVIARAR